MTKISGHGISLWFFAAKLTLVALAFAPAAYADVRSKEATLYKIHIKLDGAVMFATLEDTPTVRDFIALLPLTLKLKDYASTEKIGFLPHKLSVVNAPDGSTPKVGDISYYAPWGNLAIFYHDFAYSAQLVPLGRISVGLEHLNFSGEKHAIISLISPIETMRIQP